MRSSADQKMLMAAGALVVVLASIWIAREARDYWRTPAESSASQMPEPAYDAAALPRLYPGQTLDFSNGQNRTALLSGWSAAEPMGVWSSQRTAFFGFVVDGAIAPKQAIARAMVYLDVRKLNEQHVEVWSGGKKLVEYDLRDPDAEFTIPLGNGSVGNGAPVILRFYLPDAKPANQVVATSDARVLGLFLKAFQLVP